MSHYLRTEILRETKKELKGEKRAALTQIRQLRVFIKNCDVTQMFSVQVWNRDIQRKNLAGFFKLQ